MATGAIKLLKNAKKAGVNIKFLYYNKRMRNFYCLFHVICFIVF